MFNSLELIKSFSLETKIYCGHEYTLKNSVFCSIHDKENSKLTEKILSGHFNKINEKNYLGGIIAPGVTLSLNTLSSKASLIPPIKLKSVDKILGNNTVRAVRSGFYWGYIGSVESIINKIIKQTNKKYKIIFTGGLSYLFKKGMNYKVFIDQDITIKGLLKTIKLI